MKKYILIVWEMIPETVYLWLIPKDVLSDHELKLINFASAKLMNACKDEEVDQLDELNELLNEKWEDYKIDDEILRLEDDQHIERVITSGFVL